MTDRHDLNAMALFVHVVDAGSFTQAATLQGVPISTVSRKVSELEQALGVRLLERSTRKLRLTEIGQDYFELCRRGLGAFEAADALISDRRNELTVTCSPKSVPRQKNKIRATSRKRDAQEQVHGRTDHRVHQAG